MLGLIADVVLDLIGDPIADRLRLRRASTRLRRGQVTCFLRSVDGVVPGLTSRWIRGTATLSTGSLRFRHRGWRARSVVLEVSDIEPVLPRRRSWREKWGSMVEHSTRKLITPDGVVEWAAHRDLIGPACELLGAPDSGRQRRVDGPAS